MTKGFVNGSMHIHPIDAEAAIQIGLRARSSPLLGELFPRLGPRSPRGPFFAPSIEGRCVNYRRINERSATELRVADHVGHQDRSEAAIGHSGMPASRKPIAYFSMSSFRANVHRFRMVDIRAVG